MDPNIEKISDRLRKLIRHQESAAKIGNTEEASAFAAKIAELLTKHKLTMSDIEYQTEERTNPMGDTYFDPDDHGLRYKKVRVGWQERLAAIVANAHFCKILVFKNSNAFRLIGREQDRVVAADIYTYLCKNAQKLCDKERGDTFWAGHHMKKAGIIDEREHQQMYKGFNAAFFAAFVQRIEQRYAEMIRQVKKEVLDEGNSMALIRIDRQLALNDQFMRENFNVRNMRGARQRWSPNDIAAAKGREHADRMPLKGNGLASGEGNTLRLKV